MAACGVCSLSVLVTPHLRKTLGTVVPVSHLLSTPNAAPPLPAPGATAMTPDCTPVLLALPPPPPPLQVPSMRLAHADRQLCAIAVPPCVASLELSLGCLPGLYASSEVMSSGKLSLTPGSFQWVGYLPQECFPHCRVVSCSLSVSS